MYIDLLNALPVKNSINSNPTFILISVLRVYFLWVVIFLFNFKFFVFINISDYDEGKRDTMLIVRCFITQFQ